MLPPPEKCKVRDFTFTRVISASLIAQSIKNLPAMQETWVQFLGQKIPWRRKRQPTPVLLPGESHGQRSLAGYSPWACKSRTLESRTDAQRERPEKQSPDRLGSQSVPSNVWAESLSLGSLELFL